MPKDHAFLMYFDKETKRRWRYSDRAPNSKVKDLLDEDHEVSGALYLKKATYPTPLKIISVVVVTEEV